MSDEYSGFRRILKAIPGYDPIATRGDARFRKEIAAHYIGFVEECCTHVKGDKAPGLLQLETWQKAIFANLFGWYRPDGTRRYREALIYIPRKNSKTTMAAALVCAVAYLDEEPGGEIYSTAAEREQARVALEITSGMVEQEPYMRDRAQIYRHWIEFHDKKYYKALSAEAGTKHGLNPYVVINDELHAHRDASLTTAMTSGMGARKQPLIVHLSTADIMRPHSVCNDKLQYAKRVRDGTVEDPAFLPVIYEATPEMDWKSRRTWKLANPNYGVSVSEEYLERECKRAQLSNLGENDFKRFHLNMQTEQIETVIRLDDWDAGRREYAEAELRGQQCWIGIDLSSTQDLSAAVCLFEGQEEERITLAYTWIPSEFAELRSRRDRVPYLDFAAKGWLELTDGPAVDYRYITARILELYELFDVQGIAFDPWNATQLVSELQDAGLDPVKLPQTFANLSAPTKELLRLTLEHKWIHNGNPVYRWCASNAAVRRDPTGENLIFCKRRSIERIDPLVASVNALAGWTYAEREGPSVYESRGLITV